MAAGLARSAEPDGDGDRVVGAGGRATDAGASGAVDGAGLCRMFNRATRGQTSPTYLSSDHDRLYEFHQWQANLRILDVEAIKTVPYAPLSHPFVERLIGTIRRECLDRTLFWTAADLETKLLEFQRYYNGYRVHAAQDGRPPEPFAVECPAETESRRRADWSAAPDLPPWGRAQGRSPPGGQISCRPTIPPRCDNAIHWSLPRISFPPLQVCTDS